MNKKYKENILKKYKEIVKQYIREKILEKW